MREREREKERASNNKQSEIDMTSSWSETSKLSLVVLDKERHKKQHGIIDKINRPKVNRLIIEFC